MPAPFEYIFYPSKYVPPLGHSQLDICLSTVSTQRFFDMTSVHLPALVDGHLELERVIHHGAAAQAQPICPGRIVMEAHNGDRAEAFSFGGEMTLEAHEDYTIGRITSPAPIFSLGTDMLAPVRLMMDEVLALIAKERARRHNTGEAFWNRLAHLTPYQLFLVMLHTLQVNGASLQGAQQPPEYDLIQTAAQRAVEIVRAQDGWPAAVPTLTEAIEQQAQPSEGRAPG